MAIFASISPCYIFRTAEQQNSIHNYWSDIKRAIRDQGPRKLGSLVMTEEKISISTNDRLNLQTLDNLDVTIRYQIIVLTLFRHEESIHCIEYNSKLALEVAPAHRDQSE